MPVLEKTDVDFYWDNGYLQIAGVVAPAEVEALRAASRRMIDYGTSHRVLHRDWSYHWDGDKGWVLTRIDYPKKRSTEFAALLGHPDLLRMFESLLGPDFVVIDDALVMKLPGAGKEVPWHRDLAPGMTRAGWTLCVPGVELDSQTLDNGCVRVVPGSNKAESIDIEALVAEHGFELPGALPVETQPGDILVHAGNVLHASPPTDSPTMRRTVYISAFGIEEYMDVYQASPEYVHLQMRNMARAVQLRQELPYLDGEKPYEWNGDPQWWPEIEPGAFVEWDLIASTAADPR